MVELLPEHTAPELVYLESKWSSLVSYVPARWTVVGEPIALRSRIVLRCATGMANMAVADELGITDQTVCKSRGRFVKKGVAGLLDEPRSGVPRKITDDRVEAVIVKTLESTPALIPANRVPR